ncbi:L,D-transpeptidase ErfK/SrfK [Methylomarinovum tepidoasis]|uniref:L,D-transpeptidase ErfK/SrfK n=1 Tax=Methylomarinovum tepidoasis TaxID=2840183 RepID=A0AAU9CJN0_9GAMM|nr:L,D-transpeptidase family protein [Methylomarinovum sp. IN45]BCX89616.1 L,D-transpeptidase ErfK/SrfK [Methylomarinovum sp. IN45]
MAVSHRQTLTFLLVLLTGCQSFPPSLPNAGQEAPIDRIHHHPDGDAIGRLATLRLRSGDTLADVARHFDIGLQAIQDANPGIDPWAPETGRDILLPRAFLLPDAPRKGIVVNLAAMRLFHFSEGEPQTVESYPVGIGRAGWESPTGRTRIVEKIVHPRWVVPESIRREHAREGDPLPKIVPPGPTNPLGDYALRLGWRSYLIHGTNKPYGVGLRISHGCIRLYPEDIARLFPGVGEGTPVTIVDQPYLLGWRGKELLLEIHRPLSQNPRTLNALWRDLERRLRQAQTQSGRPIDWRRVDRAVAEARGIPLPVLVDAPRWAEYLASLPRVSHPTRWRYAYQPPPLRPGWYLVLEPLPPPETRIVTAILRHQGPPYPARILEGRVVVGPYPEKSHARRAQRRLAQELELESQLVPPSALEASRR